MPQLLDYAEQIDEMTWACRACGCALDFEAMRKHALRCMVRAEQSSFDWEAQQSSFDFQQPKRAVSE